MSDVNRDEGSAPARECALMRRGSEPDTRFARRVITATAAHPRRKPRSSAAPIAAHARDDHGAARARLLHIMRVADTHRARARVVAWYDVRLPVPFIARVDRDALQPALR